MNELLNKIGRRIGDTSDIPDELRAELKLKQADEIESQILKVLEEDFQGAASIDEILLGLYRKFNIIKKRQYVANKLYRMTKDGKIFSVDGKKGAYSTTDISPLPF